MRVSSCLVISYTLYFHTDPDATDDGMPRIWLTTIHSIRPYNIRITSSIAGEMCQSS